MTRKPSRTRTRPTRHGTSDNNSYLRAGARKGKHKMNASEYQKLASRTLIDRLDLDIPDDEIMQVWNAIGLAGEAGEVAEHIKKGVFHQHGVDREKLAKELGDVLWYAAALCTKAGLDMGEVMQGNIDKLCKRYPNGYSSEDSKRRVDVQGVQEEWLLQAAGWTQPPEIRP